MPHFQWRRCADLPLPRAGYAAGAVNARFLIAGGSYWENGKKLRTATTHLFDPTVNRSFDGPPLPERLSDAGSLQTTDASLFVIGGTGDTEGRREVLRLREGRWDLVPHLLLPGPRLRFASATDGRHLFILGGQPNFDNTSFSDEVWMCDAEHPAAGWTKLRLTQEVRIS